MTKRNAIEWAGQRLKCDAVGCDHVEEVPAMTADLIGRPCPKCGSNLLTEEDFRAGKELEGVVALINKMVGPLNVSDDVAAAVPSVSFNPHAGSITIKVEGA